MSNNSDQKSIRADSDESDSDSSGRLYPSSQEKAVEQWEYKLLKQQAKADSDFKESLHTYKNPYLPAYQPLIPDGVGADSLLPIKHWHQGRMDEYKFVPISAECRRPPLQDPDSYDKPQKRKGPRPRQEPNPADKPGPEKGIGRTPTSDPIEAPRRDDPSKPGSGPCDECSAKEFFDHLCNQKLPCNICKEKNRICKYNGKGESDDDNDPSAPALPNEIPRIPKRRRTPEPDPIRDGPPCNPCKVRRLQCNQKQPCNECIKLNRQEECKYDDDKEEEEGHPPKKRRTELTCDPCRKAKTRCDRERPCNACKKRGKEHDCTYEGKYKRSRKVDGSGTGSKDPKDGGPTGEKVPSGAKRQPATKGGPGTKEPSSTKGSKKARPGKQSIPDGKAPENPVSKSRAHKACDACRRRKSKCIQRPGLPVCHACADKGTECSFDVEGSGEGAPNSGAGKGKKRSRDGDDYDDDEPQGTARPKRTRQA